MSLLTNRKSRNTEPGKPGSTSTTAKPGDVRVTDSKKKFSADKSGRHDEYMRQYNMVPEVDAKGNRTGAYMQAKSKEPEQPKIKTVTYREKTTYKEMPRMQADQNKDQGQKPVGKYVWDDEAKRWKMAQ
jgi:hypothetical protein